MLTYRCTGIEGRDDDDSIVSSLRRALPDLPGGFAGGRVELGIRGPSGEVYRVVRVSENDAPTALGVLRRLGLEVNVD